MLNIVSVLVIGQQGGREEPLGGQRSEIGRSWSGNIFFARSDV